MNWESEGRCFDDCLVVFKVSEAFGGLSNMSNEYPLRVAGLPVRSSEALYQACRYPQRPEWQREILDAPHAMVAKMKAKKEGRRARSRPDWPQVQVEVMRWVLRVKLAQNMLRFGGLLKWSKGRPIVEKSARDRFWGAVEEKDGVLRGENWLGRLLMELREELAARRAAAEEGVLLRVPPPAIADFCLLGREIGVVESLAA